MVPLLELQPVIRIIKDIASQCFTLFFLKDSKQI